MAIFPKLPWHLHSFLLSPFSWNVNGIGIAAAALNYTQLFAKMLGLPTIMVVEVGEGFQFMTVSNFTW